MGRMVRFVGLALAACWTVGCGADVTVEFDPNPAIPGQPVEIRVTVENTHDCVLSGASAQVVVFPEGSNPNIPLAQQAVTSGLFELEGSAEEICEFFDNPTLTLCEFLLSDEVQSLPGEFEVCCEFPEFADENEQICDGNDATLLDDERLREIGRERLRALGVPVDVLLPATSLATTSSTMHQCILLGEGPEGAGFECDFGDIPAGGTAIATGTFTPSAAGRYFGLAFVSGAADCAQIGIASGGTGCAPLSVSGATMAPAMSPAALLATALGLVGVGVWARRRRRS